MGSSPLACCEHGVAHALYIEHIMQDRLIFTAIWTAGVHVPAHRTGMQGVTDLGVHEIANSNAVWQELSQLCNKVRGMLAPG